MSGNVNLYIDFGSIFTKVTAIDIEKEEITGTGKAYTTLDSDISEGLNDAINDLFKKTGELEFKEKFACSSAMGGLKMITIGLVPHYTAQASQMAALGAGARVLKVYAYKLKDEDIREISEMDVDVILICGGTDGGNKDNVIFNCEQIAKIKKDLSIVYAGNSSAVYDCRRILEGTFKDIRITENVMPELGELNIEPVRKTIKEVFLERLIRAKGFIKSQRHLSGILMPTSSAILSASALLAKGTDNEKGYGELMVVDCGGSTTDVYSIADKEPEKEGIILKGISEPYEKHTAEGDLGIRYSAESLEDNIDILKLQISRDDSEFDVDKHIEYISKDVKFIPEDDISKKVDQILCQNAVKIAVERHAGYIETEYSEYGAVFIQTGKDLSRVGYIIGTGGAIINSINPKEIMNEALLGKDESGILKPVHAKMLIDKLCIMYALGLLGENEPDKAVRMLKKYVK